jgi:hypothetical protein
MTVFSYPMMPVIKYFSVNDVAELLHRSDSDIKEFARRARERSERVEWPALRDRATGDPITDGEGKAYVVVAGPTGRVGRPSSKRGEHPWTFRRMEPPQKCTLSQRYLLPGKPLERGHETIKAMAAGAGITPGGPVRALDGTRPGGLAEVVSADGPGPVLGMVLRPDGTVVGDLINMGDRVEVLVSGTMLLPAAGPIGAGPDLDQLLWDPEAQSWLGEPVEGKRLLELLGIWRIDHLSDGGEPVAVHIGNTRGLRLQWVDYPES